MNSMLEYKGYHASIEYDAEDNIFVGEVFGITDSLNFHGTSVTELKEMFEQSIDNYLELCEKIGKSPDKEFKGTFNIRIPSEMHKRAALEAAKQKITLNQYVMKAIDQSFQTQENIKETIIFIPYGARQMNWESHSDEGFMAMFHDTPIWSKKEKSVYAGN
ncbi:MAG: type II toxin-antitoxin system HicB family antitoxin [Lachnospiraceae bacterium]|nr:type II toxin-antitoxin system HicB family antitoxin [Lachnospiraceae bacterium]